MFDRIQVVRFTAVLVAIVSLALSLPARPRRMEEGSAARKPAAADAPARPEVTSESEAGPGDVPPAASGLRPEAMNSEVALAAAALRAAGESASRVLAVVTASRSLHVAGVQR